MRREGAFYACGRARWANYLRRQTIRLPHSSTESCTVARSQGLNGLTTHTGGAAGTPGAPQGGQGGQGRALRGGLHGSGGLQSQGLCVNRGMRTIESPGAQGAEGQMFLLYMRGILSRHMCVA